MPKLVLMRCATIARLLAAVLAGVALSAAAAPAAVDGGGGSATQLDQAVFGEINAVRAAHGAPPLRLSEALARAAESHSTEMTRVGYFGHASANGAAFDTRIARFYRWRGWRYWSVGENLVSGSPDLDPETAIATWMDSPPHRTTLLGRRWRDVGVAAVHVDSSPGIYGGEPVTVITVDFGVRH